MLDEWIIILKRVNQGYMPKSFHKHACISIFCNTCGYDRFVWIMVINYRLYLVLAFYFIHDVNYCWKKLTICSWHPFRFYIISHYKNALNIFLRLLIDLIILYIYNILYIYKMFEISHAHVCKANYINNCLSSFPNVPYSCKYVLPYMYVLILACYV